MEVTFVTGKELTIKLPYSNFSIFSNYCLLWFARNGDAILEIDAWLLRSGDAFTREDFQKLFLYQNEIDCIQVNGESERVWRIKAKDYLDFIDPREN